MVQNWGQDPFRRGKRPLRGPSWEAKVTGTSVFWVVGPETGERLLASQSSLQEHSQWPWERADHMDEPPLDHVTTKGCLEEDQRAPEAVVRGPGGDRALEEERLEEVLDPEGA